MSSPTSAEMISTNQPTISIWNAQSRSGNISDPNLSPGRDFTVSVNVTGAPDFDMYLFNLEYNFEVLQLVNASLTGTLFWGNILDSSLATYVVGSVQVSVRGTATVSGSGVLLFASFKVLLVNLSVLSITHTVLALHGNAVSHLDKGGCFTNRAPLLPTIGFSSNPAPNYDQTSLYMIGKVAVGIILPESTGPRYNWTDAQVNETINGIKAAMDWWASQAPNGTLAFSYNTYVRVPTPYEPLLRPFGDTTWIADVMNRMGYTGDAYAATRAFDNDIRTRNNTDWAFTIFVADSDNSDLGFAGGSGYAYALIGGPFLVMARYSTYAWAPSPYSIVVPAHETGHIFGATDEYDSYQQYSGYLWTPDADGATGIMNHNFLKLSVSTRAQVGLVDCNADGIPDLQETQPAVFLNSPPTTLVGPTVNVTGRAIAVPHPTYNPFGQNVTVGRIARVEYSIDAGVAAEATSTHGVFDRTVEDFSFILAGLSPGSHTVYVQAIDSFGNSKTTSFQVNVPSSTNGTAEFVKWEARARYRIIDLDRFSQQVFQADVGVRNSPTYVLVRFRISDDEGQAWVVASSIVQLGVDEQRVLTTWWQPPNVQARYQVTATLYYSGLPLGPSDDGWRVGAAKMFGFRVLM